MLCMNLNLTSVIKKKLFGSFPFFNKDHPNVLTKLKFKEVTILVRTFVRRHTNTHTVLCGSKHHPGSDKAIRAFVEIL